jgi:hypothetical protein
MLSRALSDFHLPLLVSFAPKTFYTLHHHDDHRHDQTLPSAGQSAETSNLTLQLNGVFISLAKQG